MNYTKCIFLSAGLLSISLFADAQLKDYTIAEATNGIATTLATKGLKSPSWQPGTGKLWEVSKSGSTDIWKVTDFDNNGQAENIAPGTFPGKNTSMPALRWLDDRSAYFISGTNVITGALEDGKWKWTLAAELPSDAENITVDKSLNIAYTTRNNLNLQEHLSRRQVAITRDMDVNIINGKAVHRDEFGIDRGIFFSPKGNYIAYYRMDQRMVKDYPVVKWSTTPCYADMIKYPMAGGTSHEVTLCVYDIANGKTTVMNTGDKNRDHYLTAVTWSPDEHDIYIAILNRDQNHLWLNRYDARTGEKEATLFEETNAKYVHPTHSLFFIPGQNDKFVWQSERDGYNHMYLYNTQGRLLRQLTKGNWVVNDLAGYNKDEHAIIFTSSKESPLDKNIYAVKLDGTMRRIDKAAGMHSALVSPDGRYVLDVYSAAGVPKNTFVYATDGSMSKELMHSPNPLADYNRPEIKNVTLTAADGHTKLYGKLILPVNFDKNKKYPTIVYLYNGPNVQLLHNSFPESGNLWYEYMAQHGYVVFTMDGRGSWNRGLNFEQATFRHLGDVEMADQMEGVKYLKSLPYVDSKNMGVHGWSYGGFMTTSLMLKYPNVFKAAVAGGPVMDWKMYEVMYTERYMDSPQDNPKGYENANLIDKVKNLKGKLLLIHGTSDDVVVWQHSLNFIKACVDEGVQVDYFVYPGHEHNVRGKDRVHLMQKITDYFDAHLK